MSKCDKCETIFDRGKTNESKIKCKFCEKLFHYKCVGMTKVVCEFINTSDNTTWVCDSCLTANVVTCMMNKLIEMERKIDENSSKLNRIDLLSVQSSCDLTSLSETPLSTKPNGSSKRKYADVIANTNAHTDSAQYSSKRAKINEFVIKNKHDSVLVVSTDDDNLRKDLVNKVKASLNPFTDPVDKITTTAKGKIVIKCKGKDDIEVVKKKISDNVQNIKIGEPESVLPRIRVIGIDHDHCPLPDGDHSKPDDESKSKLIDVIKDQNKEIFHEKTVVEVVEIKKRKDQKLNVIFSCDIQTMKNLMQRKRLKVGWDSCVVYEELNLFRCYKCNRYGHGADECKENNNICPRCAGSHSINMCQSKILCCNNCKEFNNKNGTSEPTNHAVWSDRCKILQKKFDSKKERIRYKI